MPIIKDFKSKYSEKTTYYVYGDAVCNVEKIQGIFMQERQKSRQLPLPFRGSEGVTLERADITSAFGERKETKRRIIEAIKERQRKDVNDQKRELIIKKAIEIPSIEELKEGINKTIEQIKYEEEHIKGLNPRYIEDSDYYDLNIARSKLDSLQGLEKLFYDSEFTNNISDPNLRKRVAFMLSLKMYIRKNPEEYEKYSIYV